ncbi:MAG: hypothetical protein M3R38_19725 [Actinomycetota bacterium]|nr:hypothetical protein [Actinomycetota bacterium]
MSDEPSMLIDGPTPPAEIEEMRVTFLPQFLDAFPQALWTLRDPTAVCRGVDPLPFHPSYGIRLFRSALLEVFSAGNPFLSKSCHAASTGAFKRILYKMLYELEQQLRNKSLVGC